MRVDRVRMGFLMIDEVAGLRARLGRLESLAATAYGPCGAVRTALEHAVLQRDIEQMRLEVRAVLNVLRDYEPNR